MPRLTKRIVENVTPSSSPVVIWDDGLKGFGVKVLPTGRRVYLCKYRVGGGRTGRVRWYLLGVHGAITCDQARDLASQALLAVARGEDPQGHRLSGRSAPTVSRLWEHYRDEHLPRKKPSSRRDDETLASKYLLPYLGSHKVEQISRTDVQKLHQKLASTPYQANRLLAFISKMMNLAEIWGYRPDNTNPCRHIARFKEEKRQRYLRGDELQRLGAVLDKQSVIGGSWPYFVATIRLLLLTGARVSEVLNAKWSWVQWEGCRIDLPDSKTGAKPLFLGEHAIAVLRELKSRKEADASDYVIKGRLEGRPLVNLSKAWKQICELADIRDCRIHDLRHTAASLGVANGLSLPIVGRLLGHSQAQTTLRYAHVDVNPAVAAANVIGDALHSAWTLSAGDSETGK